MTKKSPNAVGKRDTIALATSDVLVRWKGNKYFCRDSSDWVMGDESKRRMVFLQAFDGENTRLNSYNEVGNVYDERVSPKSITPIGFGSPFILKRLSLSKALKFNEKDLDDLSPGVKLNWIKANSKYLKDEKKNGLNCHKILIEAFSKDETANAHIFMWLSPDRNFQVVSSETYLPDISKAQPVRTHNVRKWKKIEKEHFVPETADGTTWHFQSDVGPVIRDQFTYQLKSIKRLIDSDENKHFRFDFPKELEVFIIKDQKVLEIQKDGRKIKDLRDYNLGCDATK